MKGWVGGWWCTFKRPQLQVISRVLEALGELLHDEVVPRGDVRHPVRLVGDQRMHPKLEHQQQLLGGQERYQLFVQGEVAHVVFGEGEYGHTVHHAYREMRLG